MEQKINNFGNNNNIQNIQAEKIENSNIIQNSSDTLENIFEQLKKEIANINDPDLKDDVETRIELLEKQLEKPNKNTLERLKKWFNEHKSEIFNISSLALQAIGMLLNNS
ncbi:hypothetical protein XO10_00485 [Marinitoga sp. 1135]|uniref:hypothetical protein n=1 Tax=unclassified Marinitoga TaxID=2640159 RepID=UPI0009509CE5|nr:MULTISPECIES: hypothetical protein [unclassified Marinitoga]APT75039.1 hypothetical protein LN42_00470 [Marinitoga sp. 1137]NUU94798.1 hypothetical protein [Marinitoga sp. 1135]